MAPWILLTSRSRSWYFLHLFHLSSKDILVRWHSNVDNRPLLCVFVYYNYIWTIVLQPLVGKNSHILSYPHFSILWSYHVSLHFNPYFLHCSQWACRATLAWRFLYSFWASFLHPLTICHTISVDSPHNLHSGVSDDLYVLCLTEFVLKACSWATRIKPSVSFLKKNILELSPGLLCSHIWTLRANFPYRAFSLQLLRFSSFLLFL